MEIYKWNKHLFPIQIVIFPTNLHNSNLGKCFLKLQSFSKIDPTSKTHSKASLNPLESFIIVVILESSIL